MAVIKYSGKKPVRVAVVGASGYAGLETMRIISGHPAAEVVFATSNTYSGKDVQEVFPQLNLSRKLLFQPHEKAEAFRGADVFILSLPHGKSYDMIDSLLAHAAVVDISADYRLADPEMYEKWYDYVHPCPDLLETAIYGLTEIYRKLIKKARLLANPGCYPTSVALAVHPLENVSEYIKGPVIIDSKSGYSGAGRSPKPHLLFSEAVDEFTVYAPTGHRHTSEMIQEVKNTFGWNVPVTFTPHLIPVARGILSTICIPVQGDISESKIRETYESFYRGESFVKVLPAGRMPSIKHVRGTNMCHMNLFLDEDTKILKLVSVIDNLVKGAAGQAVQNMNLMFGVRETAGLLANAIMP